MTQPNDQRYARVLAPQGKRPPRRVAVIRGQDKSRFTDFYHLVLTWPWSVFIGVLALVFGGINALFALAYVAQPGSILHARSGNFWDAFIFSAQTIGSINYSVMAPHTPYANGLVIFESFIGFVYLGLMMSIMFARFSRPTARVVFSNVAIIAPFDGVPTLMLRAANQRGNQILEAEITITLARTAVTREGLVMRRFQDLEPVRKRTSLFALSWTIMHRIDETSPLYGLSLDDLKDAQMEILVLLGGTDETFSDRIYARHSYQPEQIHLDRRFVDMLTLHSSGRRVVNLNLIHETAELEGLGLGTERALEDEGASR
ncbi:MAG TPA: ion channel [Rhizomicrobium sp.]|nr:ion channel [Rhizomicrobium sp.]